MNTSSWRLLAGVAFLSSFSLASLAQSAAKPATKPLNARPASAPGTTPTPSATTASVEARANALTTNMAQALGLTPAQVEKVRVINTNSVRNVEAARVRFRQDPGKLRGYIEDIGLARLDQLKDVLTPVQFTRYQRKREEKMGIPNVQGVQGNPPPGLGNNE
jgi:hypothetical protein